MAASRFVNVSDEDISQFLEENENKNTARKTSRYVINKLLHVESLRYRFYSLDFNTISRTSKSSSEKAGPVIT